jgi:hypothetical protein
MAKKQRTQEVLVAIRRNTCYNSGRTIILVISSIWALLTVISAVNTLTESIESGSGSLFLLSITVLLVGTTSAFLLNYFGNVFLDGADSLLQIAKFSERGQRSRTEALELARLHAKEEGTTDSDEPKEPKQVSEEDALEMVKEALALRVKEKTQTPEAKADEEG